MWFNMLHYQFRYACVYLLVLSFILNEVLIRISAFNPGFCFVWVLSFTSTPGPLSRASHLAPPITWQPVIVRSIVLLRCQCRHNLSYLVYLVSLSDVARMVVTHGGLVVSQK